MGEVFTRKFVELDGDPVVGASLRLYPVSWNAAPPIDLFEIVSTDPEEQGTYYSSAGLTGTPTVLDAGVYRIEQYNGSAWVPFGGLGGSEATISPGRTRRADNTGDYLRFIVENDQLRVTSLMGDDEMLALSHVQDALLSAATAGLKKVIVGKYRHVAVWQGSGYLTIPDGLTLDLCGAEVRSLLNAPVIEFAGAGTVCNGTVAIAGGTRAANTLAGNLAVFENVRFVRSGQAAPTAASSTNAETPVSFVGCTNVTLAPPAFGAVVRKQVAIGCSGVYEVGNAADVSQIANANATGAEIGSLVQTVLAGLGSAPSTTPPFAGTAEAAEAVKQMWFGKIPALEVVAANAVSYRHSWKGSGGPSAPNGDPSKLTATITNYTGSVITGSQVINLERKVNIIGPDQNLMIEICAAGTAKVLKSNGTPNGNFIFGVDFSDALADVRSIYASCSEFFSWMNTGSSFRRYRRAEEVGVFTFSILDDSGIIDKTYEFPLKDVYVRCSPNGSAIAIVCDGWLASIPDADDHFYIQFGFRTYHPFNTSSGVTHSRESSAYAGIDGLPYLTIT